jgi:hypothetical protein
MPERMTRPLSRLLLVLALLAGSGTAEAQRPAVAASVPLPAAGPAIGRLKIFDDWAVGCDNRFSCSAVSLIPDGAGEVYGVLVWIGREGGPDGEATIELSGAYDLRGKVDLFVDNQPAGQIVAARNSARATGPNALKLIQRLGSSYVFDIRIGKMSVAAPSLSGLAQALRYMDEQQGRIGSVAALAAVGDKPASLARPVPDEVRFTPAASPASVPAPAGLTEAEQQVAFGLAKCGGRPRGDLPVELHMLDPRHALALIACDAGAENVSSVVLIATGEPGMRNFEVARFDLIPGFTGEPGIVPLLVNAQWNPARATLASFARGRPLGDCGTSETYRWDGAMFHLTEARAMPVCRGAWEWPVLWSASPIDGSTSATASAASSSGGAARFP